MMLHFGNVRLGWSWAVAHWSFFMLIICNCILYVLLCLILYFNEKMKLELNSILSFQWQIGWFWDKCKCSSSTDTGHKVFSSPAFDLCLVLVALCSVNLQLFKLILELVSNIREHLWNYAIAIYFSHVNFSKLQLKAHRKRQLYTSIQTNTFKYTCSYILD